MHTPQVILSSTYLYLYSGLGVFKPPGLKKISLSLVSDLNATATALVRSIYSFDQIYIQFYKYTYVSYVKTTCSFEQF